ncbi:MAG: cytochrome c, partial [Acidobacteriota bacterium]|nr:cytochrome c [Acidobacteriota bacterium]
MKLRLSLIASFLLLAAVGLSMLPKSQATGTKTAAKNPTFSKDIAPIFFKNCADCHRPGEAAPFSALTYKDVRPWAKSIREKVANKIMPPWHADPHVGEWSNDRRLPQKEIDTITAWVDSGAQEGDAKDLPPAPQFTEGWAIGKPDLIIPMPKEYVLKPNGPDEIQYFTVETGFTEDKWVQFAEARPGNRRIVHHIIAFVQPPAKADAPAVTLTPEERRKMRTEMEKESIFYQEGTLTKIKADVPVYNDGCATPSGGCGIKRDGSGEDGGGALLAGYAPGMNQARWPAGTVKKIPAGSKLVFQLHYSTFLGVTSEERDQSSVGLIFAKNPDCELKTRGVANHYFKIPAGTENHKATACWTVKEDIHIV